MFTLVLVLGYLAYTLHRALRAQRKGLAGDTIPLVLLRGGIIAAIGILVTAFANQNRNPNPGFKIEGLPWAVSIPVTLMIFCTIALTKTTWGRHLFAIGGNAEAARRAGIDVTKMKITRLRVSSAFAAMGGAFLASNTGGVTLDWARATSCCSRSPPPSSAARRCSADAASRATPSSARW